MSAASFVSVRRPSGSVALPGLGSFLSPLSPEPLACFRIGLSAVLLLQSLSLIGHLDDLYGRDGIVDWTVNSESHSTMMPSIAWLDAVLSSVKMLRKLAVPLTYAAYIAGLVGLLLGSGTRLAAVVAWLAHTAILTSGELSNYGVDRFAQIGLFYCVVFPVAAALSVDMT